MARLRGVGTPLMSEISYMSLADLLSLYDAQVVNGRHYELQTRWLADLLPEIISAIVAAGAVRSSPLSFLAIHHLHGAATRIAADATAFGMRQKHFLMKIVAAWEPAGRKQQFDPDNVFSSAIPLPPVGLEQ